MFTRFTEVVRALWVGAINNIVPVIVVGMVLITTFFYSQTKYYKYKYTGVKAEVVHLQGELVAHKQLYSTGFQSLVDGFNYQQRYNSLTHSKLNEASDDFDQDFTDWYNSPIPNGVFDLFQTTNPSR